MLNWLNKYIFKYNKESVAFNTIKENIRLKSKQQIKPTVQNYIYKVYTISGGSLQGTYNSFTNTILNGNVKLIFKM